MVCCAVFWVSYKVLRDLCQKSKLSLAHFLCLTNSAEAIQNTILKKQNILWKPVPPLLTFYHRVLLRPLALICLPKRNKNLMHYWGKKAEVKRVEEWKIVNVYLKICFFFTKLSIYPGRKICLINYEHYSSPPKSTRRSHHNI